MTGMFVGISTTYTNCLLQATITVDPSAFINMPESPSGRLSDRPGRIDIASDQQIVVFA